MKKIISYLFLLFSFLLYAQENATQLSLQQAIQYSITNNVDIQKAILDIKKAEKQIWETTASGLPQIDGKVEYQYNIDVPVAVFGGQVTPIGSKQTLAPNIQLKQLIFSGSYLVALKSAQTFAEISELAKQKTEIEIESAVIKAYSGAKVAEENAQILKDNLEISERNLFEIKEIYKAGFASEQDVDQIKFTHMQLKTAYNSAIRQQQIAKNTLKYLIGINQDFDVVLSTELEDLIENDMLLNEQNPVVNIENHIDYRLANNQVAVQELQVKYEKTQALPSLSGFLSHTQNRFSQDKSMFSGFGDWAPTTVVGLVLNVPIFSSFERRAKTQQAELEAEKARIERENTVEDLTKEIKNANLELQNALDNYYAQNELVELSQSIKDKEQIKFFEGLSSGSDLRQAENQLFQAQSNYIQSLYQVVQEKTDLLKAMGRFN